MKEGNGQHVTKINNRKVINKDIVFLLMNCSKHY